MMDCIIKTIRNNDRSCGRGSYNKNKRGNVTVSPGEMEIRGDSNSFHIPSLSAFNFLYLSPLIPVVPIAAPPAPNLLFT